jgi:hypothetical protein
LWEQECSSLSNHHVLPVFTEDGKLGVCLGQSVKILEARSGDPVFADTLPTGVTATALAIKPNGKGIVVSRKGGKVGGHPEAHLSRMSFPFSYASRNAQFVVETTMISDIRLIYSTDGRYLFAICKPEFPYQTIIRFMWKLSESTPSPNQVDMLPFPRGQYLDGPILTIETGIIICSSNSTSSESSVHTNLAVHHKNRIFETKYGAQWMLCGAVGTGFTILSMGNEITYFPPKPMFSFEQGHRERSWPIQKGSQSSTGFGDTAQALCLWTWDGKAREPQWVGRLKSHDVAPLNEIKAFAWREPEEVTLIMENGGHIVSKVDPEAPRVVLISRRRVRKEA